MHAYFLISLIGRNIAGIVRSVTPRSGTIHGGPPFHICPVNVLGTFFVELIPGSVQGPGAHRSRNRHDPLISGFDAHSSFP